MIARALVVVGMIAGAAILTRRPPPPPVSPKTRQKWADAYVAQIEAARARGPLPTCPRSLDLARYYQLGYLAHPLDAPDDNPDACINCGIRVLFDPHLFTRYSGSDTPE